VRVVNKRSGEKGVYVGRPSALGNPYSIGQDGGRATVIQSYRRWLWRRLQAKDSRVLAALRELSEDSVLVCWCAPAACHAEVIARAWAWARATGLL
jgi:hypothetical protein